MKDDRHWMRQALKLARRGWGKTSPNPMVGAVVCQDGECVGRGWHPQAGQPHAEPNALADAGDKARGGTLYVTLEPCSTHGRTPPCTEAVIAAGIARCVVGTLDPNPSHAGRGIKLLRAAGIEVTIGIEDQACQRLNEAFNCWIRYRRPYVLLKLAMTLDGKIATRSGHSQWITGPPARRHVQRLRQWADAIMVGGETVRRDNPQLLVRTPANWPHQPLRLIATRSGNLGNAPAVLTDGLTETRLVAPETATDWHQLLAQLGESGVSSLLVEGGGELAAAMLDAGVVDKVAFFIAPKILTGADSRPVVGGTSPALLTDALDLQDMQTRRVGADLLVTGYLTDVHRYS